jgi:DNA primase
MAGFFSPETLEQVSAASDIVELVGTVLPLKKNGANFVALCPFHKEKSPSFNVNPQKQIFHCFGCHKGGDVFSFLMAYENISFPEAVQRLAERARIPLAVESRPGEAQARFLKDTLFRIHEQITQRWHTALLNDAGGQIARDYLARRGVSDEAVRLFLLRYAPDAWDDTVNWAKSRDHELPQVEKAGLILRKEDTDRYYDRFRGRLIFPICDEQGRVVAFSGRVLAGDEKTAKYVNSPETPLFTKGRVIYGLDKSKRALLDAGSAIVCEGQLDLIACYMAGLHNVVAPQGTALTADHARILKRYVSEVILCFDSDAAGQNAAVRALDDLLASGLAVRVAAVPAPHDPDSFIRESGAEAMRELIGRAENFFDFHLHRLCALNDLAADRGRQAVVQQMALALHKTGNAVLLDTYARKTAQRLGVAPDAVRSEFKKTGAPGRPAPAAAEVASPEAHRPPPIEVWLLKLLFQAEDRLDWVAAHLDRTWLQPGAARHLVERCLTAQAENRWHGAAALMTELEAEEPKGLLAEVLSDPRAIPNPAGQLGDALRRLRNQALDLQLAELGRRITAPEASDADKLRLLQEQQQLNRLKREPLAALAGPGGRVCAPIAAAAAVPS